MSDSPAPVPTIGRIVQYRLHGHQAAEINRRRDDSQRSKIADQSSGAVVHVGNAAAEGQVYPLIITRVWGDHPGAAVNGQVLLDGNDSLWVCSVTAGEGPGKFTWPGRV